MESSRFATPEERARKRVKDLSSLVWHASAYAVVNVFLWVLDIVQGGGLEYAYWTTIGWGVGLAAHALAYYLGRGDFEERKYQEFLAEEQRREGAG